MGSTICTPQTAAYLPDNLKLSKQDIQNELYYFEHETGMIHFKLVASNIYKPFFRQVYPDELNENELNEEMLDVLKTYTSSRSNECYIKTNLNLLSANVEQIDWQYVNQLRSIVRGLVKTNLRQTYYRGLTLSDIEIGYYMENQGKCFFTTSFLSFTVDRLLIYSGNAIMILNMDRTPENAKKNITNIWKWSALIEEKEALLVVGSHLRILNVHYYGNRWEIEIELIDEETE